MSRDCRLSLHTQPSLCVLITGTYLGICQLSQQSLEQHASRHVGLLALCPRQERPHNVALDETQRAQNMSDADLIITAVLLTDVEPKAVPSRKVRA